MFSTLDYSKILKEFEREIFNVLFGILDPHQYLHDTASSILA